MARILIIDDNTDLTTLLTKVLAKFGYSPIAENDSMVAVNTVRQIVPDLILLDVMMPQRDGGQILTELRGDASVRNIPVILLTALAREAQGLSEIGGIKSAIIGKPVNLKELMNEIETQLAAARTYNQQQSYQQQQQNGGFSQPQQPHPPFQAPQPTHHQPPAPAQPVPALPSQNADQPGTSAIAPSPGAGAIAPYTPPPEPPIPGHTQFTAPPPSRGGPPPIPKGSQGKFSFSGLGEMGTPHAANAPSPAPQTAQPGPFSAAPPPPAANHMPAGPPMQQAQTQPPQPPAEPKPEQRDAPLPASGRWGSPEQ